MRQEFPKKVKVAAFERAGGRCEACTARLGPGNVFYDHVIPCALGGEPVLSNCEALCKICHGRKTSTQDVPQIRKADRQRATHLGAKKRKARPMPGTKASGIRKRMSGKVESW